ncbi:MAG: hypothetical protein OXU77_08855 [Gammaproteobacteria bacterium]|nr:hypothetical protein [Gammaproteobacteria bacterium]MDE0191340.1 hypothetical protein [Gammaproteobacteria bacterium]MDE0441563.1 hypothetical protein [Gammaproteobacteria bacterium]
MADGLIEVGLPTDGVSGHVCSVVIVGDRFAASMFDHQALFGGAVDVDSQMVAGPFAQYTYQAGLYGFSVVPNRIDVRAHRPEEVLPAVLMEAVGKVGSSIEQVRSAVVVSGVGLNYDAPMSVAFDRGAQRIGEEYCRGLFGEGVLSRITNAELTGVEARARLVWSDGAMRYAVRIEPEEASGGERVFVGVNGHQNLTVDDTLASALAEADAFRRNVEAIRGRL